MKKYIMLIIFIITLGYFSTKPVLQYLITKNYDAREAHKLPDKWYWADVIYLYLYGDYSFYQSKL